MNEATREIVRAVGKCLLPYPDPVRRWRIRQDARALVSWVKWPGDDATELEVAELALLRVLWLQRKVRTSARLRQRDAASLLARTAIDTCITGLWCLYNTDAVEKMRKDNAASVGKMMTYLVGTVTTREFVDRVLAAIGGDKGRVPLGGVNRVPHHDGRCVGPGR